jgi:DNA mismatch repair protein MutS
MGPGFRSGVPGLKRIMNGSTPTHSDPPTTFQSILCRRIRPDILPERVEAPEFFHDLNIDQIVAGVTGKDEYGMKPFFYRQLGDVDEIAYRQQIMRDLQSPRLFELVGAFADKMMELRSHLRAVEQAYYRPHKNGWLLEAAAIYCAAVQQLTTDLRETELQSPGFREFREYMSGYVALEPFSALAADTERVKADLHSVMYSVVIRGLSVTVRKYQDEIDYSAEIGQTISKFQQGDVNDYLIKFPEFTGMGHVEAQIAELVARLHPEVFSVFDQYCEKYQKFVDPIIERFDREVQFYLSYLQYIGKLRSAGLPFCYPTVERGMKEIYGDGVFDLALAAKLVTGGTAIVQNDFYLQGGERVLVVSGPNQGGKTTFARTLGQLHYLASLGYPVPGSKAQLFLCDRILTHFEKEETIENLRGKLQDDLLRIHRVLQQATPNSLIVINEIFSSTALEDAVFLATEIMHRILALDCLCVCVTFLDEVAALGPSVASMVSTVVPENPALRTFKLVRHPADGRAYAIAIAEKHQLTYQCLEQRLAS